MNAGEFATEELVERLRGGESQVLGTLFERYRSQLHRMVEFRLDRRLRGRVDASDVLQDAFVDVSQYIDRFISQPEMPLIVWLRIMTTQRMIDIHRRHLGAEKRNAAQDVSLNQPGVYEATSACIAVQLVGNLPTPSAGAQLGERIQKLEETLERMDPLDREVLAMRHFEELSNGEVAEILGLSKSAASNRYVRALKRLKDISSHEQF